MLRELPDGFVGSGLVEDGEAGGFWLVGTVLNDPVRGVLLQVPYRAARPWDAEQANDQFAGVSRWFAPSAPAVPTTLRVTLGQDRLSFFGCRMTNRTMNPVSGAATGTVQAENVVLGAREDADADGFARELLVRELRSRIDGLQDLARLTASTDTFEADGDGRLTSMQIELRSGPVIAWVCDDAHFSVESNWSTRGPQNRRTVEDDVVLVTRFESPQPVSRHIQQQRKIVALMTVLVGSSVRFRQHELRDEQFGARWENDRWKGPWYPVLHRWTHPEHRAALPEERAFERPLAVLGASHVDGVLAVSESGLQRWLERFEAWERVVLPLVGAYGRTGSLVEDQAVTAGMCLEAAGHLIGPVVGEEDTYHYDRPTARTYVLRVLADLGLVLAGPAESVRGLAHAIARNYNSIKHYNDGRLPEATHTQLASQTGLLALRAFLLQRTLERAVADADADPVLGTPVVGALLEQLRRQFNAYGVRITAAGRFVSSGFISVDDASASQ